MCHLPSLRTQKSISVTTENAISLSLLAKKFFLSDLASECARFPVSVSAFSSLCERVSQLERQLSSLGNPPPEIEDAIESQEEAVETLHLALGRLQTSLDCEFAAFRALRQDFARFHGWVLLTEDKSLDGMIWYLTKKRGGNVHETGIVSITSNAVYHDYPQHSAKMIADLNSSWSFPSVDEPGQRICWDFSEMRIR
jgi:hypothetical protein